MKMMILAVSVLVFSMSFSALALGCDVSREIEKELSIGNVTDIRIEAGAGELLIKGGDRVGQIGLVAKLCAPNDDVLADMDVLTVLDDEVVNIGTRIPRTTGGYSSPKIDLELLLPLNSIIDVKDSSGDVEIKKVAGLSLQDSSGDIFIKNIAGLVKISDSSGDMEMHKIGSAQVSDSSGLIQASKVQGDFIIEVDSSGNIEVDKVGGNVLVKVDSSGSIEVQDVAGAFTVEKDGSGKIKYRDVLGNVSIPDRKK